MYEQHDIFARNELDYPLRFIFETHKHLHFSPRELHQLESTTTLTKSKRNKMTHGQNSNLSKFIILLSRMIIFSYLL